MAIEKDLLDQLLAGRDPNEIFAREGLLDDLKKALSERILNAELDEHIDGERGEGNRRNGSSKKMVLTGTSKLSIDIPRDRAGTFDPKLIAKYQRRFPDFDEKIISLVSARHDGAGNPRPSRGTLRYRRVAGPDLGDHRRRPGRGPGMAEPAAGVLLPARSAGHRGSFHDFFSASLFDAIRVKIRDEGFVRNKAVHVALGILPDGTKEILGIRIEQTEGAKFLAHAS